MFMVFVFASFPPADGANGPRQGAYCGAKLVRHSTKCVPSLCKGVTKCVTEVTYVQEF
jgi:hypothetical protein